MANYRGIDVPAHLRSFLQYMGNVDECREALQILSQQWDLLDVLSRVIETGTEVQRTRSEFRALNSELISALADESLRKVTSVLNAKAQVSVDVIIRNLFERTADIGFLATDEDLRAFLMDDVSFSPEIIRERLLEYQAKYSVYENIIVLNTQGQIVASVSDKGLPKQSEAPLITDALNTSDAYVETFGPSDLVPGDAPGLTYAYRITQSQSSAAKNLGVLVLVFKFDHEMEGIFKDLKTEDDWSELTLLDDKGYVLASTDSIQFCVGAKLDVDPDLDYQIVKYAGRRYIAATRRTTGYQGFYGLGWLGCALMPVEFAFEQSAETVTSMLEDHQFHAIAKNEHLLSNAVREIPRKANEIQAELNRTVWNGHMVSCQNNSEDSLISPNVAQQTLLSEISSAGERTSRIFGDAVSALNRTAIGLIIEDCSFSSALALDLMDRNLYERANDCRWWALTTQFRKTLAKVSPSEAELRELTSTLRYINDLYTVYTNLILFDQEGRIIAVSNANETALIGTEIDLDLRSRVTRFARTSYYGVSDFEPTPLYADRPTYIYGAPIHDLSHTSKIIGGIAIVFDSEPEFPAMLRDASPKNNEGQIQHGCRTLYIDQNKNIIASSDGKDTVGTKLDIPDTLLNLGPGEQTSTILTEKGEIFAIGIQRSTGYREYKSASDEYENTIYAVCILKLGSTELATTAQDAIKKRPWFRPLLRDVDNAVELGTFRIGASWFGIPSENIVEAVSPDKFVELPHTPSTIAGCFVYRNETVLLLDIHEPLLGTNSLTPIDQSTAVIFRGLDGKLVALKVDDLGELVRLDANKFEQENKPSTTSVVKAVIPGEHKTDLNQNAGTMMLVLDIDGIMSASGVTLAHKKVA